LTNKFLRLIKLKYKFIYAKNIHVSISKMGQFQKLIKAGLEVEDFGS